MNAATRVVVALVAVVFTLLGGAIVYSCTARPSPAYSIVPTPYGEAKVVAGQKLKLGGTNGIIDNRSGKQDQGKATGDEVKINPGEQNFNLNTMMGSTEKGTYFAKHIVKSAWIIILIGAIILGIGIALSFTGIGTAVAIPIMIIGAIVMGAGFVAMMVESAGGMWILLAAIVPVGYMIWKSKQKTATIADTGNTLDEITADIQALAAHATATNWAVVQAQIDAMKKKLGL